MNGRCAVGVFASDKGIRALVDKLAEMELEETDISVIKADGFDYATNLGPLKGATKDNLGKKLIHVGLSADLARNFKGYLNDGGAIVAVACNNYNVDDVIEMLGAFGASDIQVSD